MFQTKVVGKTKTHILCSVKGFFFFNRAVCYIMWKNIVEPNRPQMTTWCMRISRLVPKATNIVSVYVILIAFPPQQWLQERDSMLRYTRIARLVYNSNVFPKLNKLLTCGDGIQLGPGILHRCALPSHRTCISTINPTCARSTNSSGIHHQLPHTYHYLVYFFCLQTAIPPTLGTGPYLKGSYF